MHNNINLKIVHLGSERLILIDSTKSKTNEFGPIIIIRKFIEKFLD